MDSTASGVVITGLFTCAELNYEGLSILNHSEQEDPFVLIIDQDGKPSCQLTGIGSSTRELGTNIWTDGDSLYLTLNFVESAYLDSVNIVTEGNSQLIWKTCLPCDTLTSINETLTTNPTLHIYPNPASQSIRVEVAGNSQQVYAVEVIDMLGNAVLHYRIAPTGQQIDISTLANGIYTLAATMQSGETLRQRLVVSR
jgi:hypothetical protein